MTNENDSAPSAKPEADAEDDFRFDPAATREEVLARGKELIAEARAKFAEVGPRAGGRAACRAFARFHDRLIRGFHRYVLARREAAGEPAPGSHAVVAVGGYGRRDLAPYSDVDVLFLVGPKKAAQEPFVKELMHLLIDVGLDLGYSVRRIEDCLAALGTDLQTTTSLMESRPVAGSRPLCQRFTEAFFLDLRGKWRRWFLRAKFQEWTERRRRYDDSVYMLQPNLKEGAGGLRDVHSVRWLLIVAHGAAEREALRTLVGFTEDEVERYRRAEEFVLRLRNELHVRAKRKDDTLDHAAQIAIAARLGYAQVEHIRAEEAMMRDYYRAARDVARLSARAFLTLLRLEKGAIESLVHSFQSRRVDGEFLVRNGSMYVDPKKEAGREWTPLRIVDAFGRARRHGLRVSEKTRDAIERALPGIDPAAWDDPAVHAAFLEIAKGTSGVARTFADMHDCGALCAVVPEFERIRCMVRIDYYHRYTVDEHLLRAVENFEKLRTDPKLSGTHAGRVAAGVERVDLLNLALLLHDVGKGFGKGHALLGGGLIQRIGQRMDLPHEDVETLGFLVRAHLRFSHISQRRDPDDPKLGREFAAEVGSRERLDLLYVHSVCDLMAVGPEAWNDWKAQLYSACYRTTAAAMEGNLPAAVPVERLRSEMFEKLLPILEPGLVAEAEAAGEPLERVRRRLRDFVDNVPERYLQQADVPTMDRHFRMLRRLGPASAVVWELSPGPACSELTVVSLDLPGSFGSICGALAAKDLNILSAEIFSTSDGYAIDAFRIATLENRPLPDGFRLDAVREDLNQVFLGRKTMEQLVARHKSRLPVKRPPVARRETTVNVLNDESQEFTLVEVVTGDRPGLLFKVAAVFAENRLNIHRARVATEAYGALDVFFVTDYEYNKINDPARVEKLKREVKSALDDPEPPAPPGDPAASANRPAPAPVG